MAYYGGDKSTEYIFQNDMIKQLLANGWLLGDPKKYNRELALYSEDVLGFVKETQDEQWQKFKALYPNDTDQKFLERVATQLNKADPTPLIKRCAPLAPWVCLGMSYVIVVRALACVSSNPNMI